MTPLPAASPSVPGDPAPISAEPARAGGGVDKGPFRQLLTLLLRPDRGRLHNALVVTAGVGIMLVIWETFRIPGTVIACYVVLFMARPDRASTVMGACLLAVAGVLGVLLAVLILVAGLSEPALRIGLMALATFFFMSLSRAPGVGLLFFGIGFLAVEALTAADSITGIVLTPGTYGNANAGPPQGLFLPPEEALLHSTLWMMLEFASPSLLLLLLGTLFGLDPGRLLRGGLDDRLALVEDWCGGKPGAAGRLEAAARQGSPELAKLAGLAAKEHGTGKPSAGNEARIHATMRLMLCCLASEWLRPGVRPGWAAALGTGCAVLRAPAGASAPIADEREDEGDPVGAEALRNLRLLRGPPAPPPELPPGPPPDPSSGGTAQGRGVLGGADFRYGFKVTLSVMTCYVLNNALDWTAINTSITTCFVVALGTLGESGHKMSLRVCGCLVGGALGIGSVVFLMPVMTDIGHLLLLFAPVVFASAWIAMGSERIAYSGLQIALAFYVTVLDDYGPTTDIEGARNRLVGILVGITVTYLVSALVWPVRADRQAANKLADALRALARLLRGNPDERQRAEQDFAGAVIAAQALLLDEPFEGERADGLAADGALAARVQELVLPAIMLAAAPADPAREPFADWLEAAAARLGSRRFAADGLPPPPALPPGPGERARRLLHRALRPRAES